MPIIFNGTTVNKIIKDGVDLDALNFGNTQVFTKRALTINFKGLHDAQSSSYPIYIKSPSINDEAFYGATKSKTLYIPNGETVTIDASSYRNYRTDISNLSYSFAVTNGKNYGEAGRFDIHSNTKYKLSFTMDRDITLDPWWDSYDEYTYMGELNAYTEDYGVWWRDCMINIKIPSNMTTLTNYAWS